MGGTLDRTAPTGVLYVNLGSPAAPTPAAVRAFLDEFLGDPLVVDLNPLLWLLVRKWIILPRRAPRSAELYQRVWTPEGAPLAVQSRRFANALARELGTEFRVELAMRYGQPSIAAGLEALDRAGCARVILLTAFPQASQTTTGTVEAEARRVLSTTESVLELDLVPPYFAAPGYIAALAERVRAAGFADGAHVVFSFHGLPVRYVEGGDPYREHCEATAFALAHALDLTPTSWTLAYQSRFGREPWLEPDVALLAPELAAAKKRVFVTAPSFTADCLETLEELGLRLREECKKRGGELVLVPSLNDSPSWVRAAAELVRASAATPVVRSS
jgi:ferrochelatase